VSKQQKIAELFDQILFYLWDVSTGSALNQRDAYKGATRFARFLLSEISRRDRLHEQGGRATFRRGETMPDSLINAWAWNVLEDCKHYKIPPPRALLDVLYIQLACSQLTGRQKSPERARYRAMQMLDAGASMREAARQVGVNVSTVSAWVKKAPQFDQEEYSRLRKLTHVEAFYPPDQSIPYRRRNKL